MRFECATPGKATGAEATELNAGVCECVVCAVQRAGIVVRMVTGDNVVTASAIARECHILTPEGEAVEGQAFRKMSYAERIQRFGPRLERLQVHFSGDAVFRIGSGRRRGAG